MEISDRGPNRIRLEDDRKQNILTGLTHFFGEEFDEVLSPYQAERLLEFFTQKLGPAVYNQAIQDARKFLLQKLEDLDAEFHEPDPHG